MISVLSSILLAACASTKTTDDIAAKYGKYSSAQLYQMSEQSLVKRRFSAAVKTLEAMDSLYPFSEYSEPALRDLIYAYYQKGDYASSEAVADRFIRVYPRSDYVDYAYYMKGMSQLNQDRSFLQRAFPINLALRDLTSAKKAFVTFHELVTLLPSSRYAPAAKQQMIYLRNLFAQHELEVAVFYYKRYAYVASANRATEIIQHYPGSPQTEQALIILVSSDHALGLHTAANDALSVLETNYPNSPALPRLRQLVSH
jgi:outer membrane protein assembly factor BamD